MYFVKVNVDDLIMGLGPSFYTEKTYVYFTRCIMYMGFLHVKIIFLPSTSITFFKSSEKGGGL